MFDVRLILEFSGAATDILIVKGIENVEFVCELCTMKNIERVLPLRLLGGALAICRQLSAEQGRCRTDQAGSQNCICS